MSPLDLVVTPQGTRFMGRLFPSVIGRTGLTRSKREGDLATPCGLHQIAGLLYRPDRIAAHQLPPFASPIGPRDIWCDDPTHFLYNQRARAPIVARHEKLRRPDPLYDLILTTDWNWPLATPGKGSAIFLHIWRAPRVPTAGCVAFRRDHLLWIANRLSAHSRIIIQP